VSSYVLEVHARDSGIPVLSSFVMVNIEISDANDNPPLFSQPNYTAIVQVGNLQTYSAFRISYKVKCL
jgi:protocadherin Fat 1/2/3